MQYDKLEEGRLSIKITFYNQNCHGSLWNFHCAHLVPIPSDCICIYVPFVHHGAVDYCYIGACEYLFCVFWAFVPLWIVQMITGLVPCDNHCALV